MAETTNLREAINEVSVVGKLSEIKLEDKTENGVTKKTGYITLVTDKEKKNHVVFNVMINKLKKNGEHNPAYTGINTFMAEAKSIAQDGDEDASKVEVRKGSLNIYYSENKKTSTYSFKNMFFSVNQKSDKEVPYKAEFKLEVYIKGITPEMVKDEDGDMVDTGRKLVHVWVPLYNGGIEEITLVAPDANGIADYFESEVKAGQTMLVYGDIISTLEKQKTELANGFGKKRVEEKTSAKHELLITGGSEPYEDDDPKAYSKEVIDAALNVREERLAEARNKTNNNSGKPQSSGRTLPGLGIDM